jgi:hypothetical protein
MSKIRIEVTNVHSDDVGELYTTLIDANIDYSDTDESDLASSFSYVDINTTEMSPTEKLDICELLKKETWSFCIIGDEDKSKGIWVKDLSEWLDGNSVVKLNETEMGYVASENGFLRLTYLEDGYMKSLYLNDENCDIVLNPNNTIMILHDDYEDTITLEPYESETTSNDGDDLYIDRKEAIAGILFEDNDLSEDYVAPDEEDCHRLAELILKRLNLK